MRLSFSFEMLGFVTFSAFRIFGSLPGGELDVDDGTDDLDDPAFAGGAGADRGRIHDRRSSFSFGSPLGSRHHEGKP